MHVHIGRKRDARNVKADESFIPISESGTTFTFFYKVSANASPTKWPEDLRKLQEWTQLGSKIVELAGSILAAERVAFELLRREVCYMGNHQLAVMSNHSRT